MGHRCRPINRIPNGRRRDTKAWPMPPKPTIPAPPYQGASKRRAPRSSDAKSGRTLVRGADRKAIAARRSPQHPRTGGRHCRYLDVSNRDPKPFIQTKTGDQILGPFCKRISNSGHQSHATIWLFHDDLPVSLGPAPFRSLHSYLELTTGRRLVAMRCAPARSPTCPGSCDRHP